MCTNPRGATSATAAPLPAPAEDDDDDDDEPEPAPPPKRKPRGGRGPKLVIQEASDDDEEGGGRLLDDAEEEDEEEERAPRRKRKPRALEYKPEAVSSAPPPAQEPLGRMDRLQSRAAILRAVHSSKPGYEPSCVGAPPEEPPAAEPERVPAAAVAAYGGGLD